MSESPSDEVASYQDSWEFPGWGKSTLISDFPSTENQEVTSLHHGPATKLGAWKSTAICGNDITSSVLYVSALCTAQAGAYAPLVLLIVSGVLFLYRKVYAEVGSALLPCPAVTTTRRILSMISGNGRIPRRKSS